MNLLKHLLRRLFQSKVKQQRRLFQEWQRTRPPLPDLPTIDLAKQRIETESVPVVPGTKLEEHRRTQGLTTIRLVPMWTDSFPMLPDDSWLNSQSPKPQAPVTPLPPVYEIAEPETEHRLAAVRKFHEERNKR